MKIEMWQPVKIDWKYWVKKRWCLPLGIWMGKGLINQTTHQKIVNLRRIKVSLGPWEFYVDPIFYFW